MKCHKCGREVTVAVYFEGKLFCSETCVGQFVAIFDDWLTVARKDRNEH